MFTGMLAVAESPSSLRSVPALAGDGVAGDAEGWRRHPGAIRFSAVSRDLLAGPAAPPYHLDQGTFLAGTHTSDALNLMNVLVLN